MRSSHCARGKDSAGPAYFLWLPRQWTPTRGKNGRNVLRQNVREWFEVGHLERVELGTSYVGVVQHVTDIMQRPPVRRCDLILDQTGCGGPVGDMFDTAGLRPVRVVIGSGFEATPHGNRKWAVPKVELISCLDAIMHSEQLKIADALREAPALAEELKNFRRHVSEAGRYTYGARIGLHDDLVLSVALAAWWLRIGRNKGGSVGIKHIKGLYL
jgi:hypothetical protein